MAILEEKAQLKLIDMLGTYSNRLLRSGYCSFEEISVTSIDQWEMMQKNKAQDNLILLLQHTNSNLRYFYNGIRENPEFAAQRIGGPFLRDSRIIKESLMKYLKTYPAHINVELWCHEMIRSMSTITTLFRGHMDVKIVHK